MLPGHLIKELKWLVSGRPRTVQLVCLLWSKQGEASGYRHTGGAEHQHLSTVSLASPVESHQPWPGLVTRAAGTWGLPGLPGSPSAHHVATPLGAARIPHLTSIVEAGLWTAVLFLSPLFSYSGC